MTSATTRLAAGIAALAAAALTSCSTAATQDHSAHQSTVAATGEASAPHDADDAMFGQMMIPHHEQAVELAGLVPERSTNPALVTLAATIAGQQKPEIDSMKAMLTAWGVNPDDASHGSGHAGITMQGMVGEATMVTLEALRGAEFDKLWLTSMISHHRGAIDMAKSEIADGKNPEMIALARNIVTAQQAEIDQMTAMQSGSAG
jgi:uncharacterized protein (DUF305 family)